MSRKILLLGVAILIFAPLVVIWALRALGADADYGFGSWLAVIVIAMALKHVQK